MEHRPRADERMNEIRHTDYSFLTYRKTLSYCWIYACVCVCVCILNHSVTSDSFLPHGLQLTRLPCPSDFPGKNTGVGSHFLLQGIFQSRTQTHLLHLLHWQGDSLPLLLPGKPSCLIGYYYDILYQFQPYYTMTHCHVENLTHLTIKMGYSYCYVTTLSV